MRLVWIVIPLVLIGIIGVQESFAICIEDEDWPDKPCYAIPGEFFTSKEKQPDWLEYHQYKGDDWYGEKHLEMKKNIESKTLKQWIGESPKPINSQNENNQNYNVWFLQYIYGHVPHYENGKYLNESFKSPLYQVNQGKPFGKIECNHDLTIAKRSSDGSPLCIKKNTAKIFATRGIIIPGAVLIEFSTDKDTYQVGESVSITMQNIGETRLTGKSTPCGFDILNENGDRVDTFWGNFLAECILYPSEKIIGTWDAESTSVEYVRPGLKLVTNEPVRPGTYTLSTNYHDDIFEKDFSFEKQIEITDPTNAFELLDSTPSSENIIMLKDAELVFSGKVISKIPGTSVPDFYTIDFKVIENFRNAKDDAVTVYTNERIWNGCAGLEENMEYLIFAEPKNHGTMTCYNATSLPTDITNELREFSSRIPWW